MGTWRIEQGMTGISGVFGGSGIGHWIADRYRLLRLLFLDVFGDGDLISSFELIRYGMNVRSYGRVEAGSICHTTILWSSLSLMEVVPGGTLHTVQKVGGFCLSSSPDFICFLSHFLLCPEWLSSYSGGLRSVSNSLMVLNPLTSSQESSSNTASGSFWTTRWYFSSTNLI